MPLPALPIRMGSVLTEKELNVGALNTSAPDADISTTDLPTANASTADANRSQRAASARPATPPPVSAETAPAETTPVLSAPASASAAPAAQNRSARAKPARLPAARRKLFVLDTNVLLHDPSSLFRFEAHDVFLPMVVLEELDHLKKGMSELARNARQASRFMDHLVNSQAAPAQGLAQGVALDGLGHTDARGHLHFQHTALKSDLPVELPAGKADNLILQVVHALAAQHPKRDVVLVSKDINMRLKALSLGLRAEDYFNDHVIDDSDLLYEGVLPLPDNFWHKHGKDVESWQEGGAASTNHHSGQDWSKSPTLDLIRSRIKVKSLNFMRGRTFQHKYLIIDEAQNLTPKQMKTLVTRAGPGTKIVCLGNIAQIDTPYLTEASSGLTYVVDRFKGWPHAGHITLQRGERSRLADYASEAL